MAPIRTNFRFAILPLLLGALAYGEERLVLDPLADGTTSSTEDATATPSLDPRGLTLVTGTTSPWPGITFRAPGEGWDLSAAAAIELDVVNLDQEPVAVVCRIDCPGGDGAKNSLTREVVLDPGRPTAINVPLVRKPHEPAFFNPIGLRSAPLEYGGGGGRGIDVAHVSKIIVFAAKPERPRTLLLVRARAVGAYRAPGPADAKLPMVDRYVQFIHADWPGKVATDADLFAQTAEETRDLDAHPGPADRDPWGGWAGGPSLRASGDFRVEKVDARWWLVDPAGKLFFSWGIDCVGGLYDTPIDERRDWFSWLPEPSEPLGKFYGHCSHCVRGYYVGKTTATYNQSMANLARKYGADWWPISRDLAHRRLRSWGMNTVGNWSHPEVCARQRTPYTVAVWYSGPTIPGTEGLWQPFHDVFDPGYAAALRTAFVALGSASAADPWCIGYFIDNELGFGDGSSLGRASLAAPPEQPAKIALINDLRAKYATIEALDAAWGTTYASWDEVARGRAQPADPERAKTDLSAFDARAIETYYAACGAIVRELAPRKLYLGSRYYQWNDTVIAAAARHCDVLSFNLYRRGLEGFSPSGAAIDRPMIIGEFHFGTNDRVLPREGLLTAESQCERAAWLEDYALSALHHPSMVGCHWFQYWDEPATGRALDGENCQIGFLDGVDRPYAELISASRRIGERMYRERAQRP
jgi:hypothetical protein